MPAQPFYARTDSERPDLPAAHPGARWQLLRDHLNGVAELARRLAGDVRDEDDWIATAYWAGLLHDLGKYSDNFQDMLHAAAGDLTKRKVEHSGHGTALAVDRRAWDVAFAVCGHHSGLGTLEEIKQRARKWRADAEAMQSRAALDLNLPDLASGAEGPPALPRGTPPTSLDVRIRLLASCLIDADRLNAAGADGEPHNLADAAAGLDRLLAYVAAQAARPSPAPVREARRAALEACLRAAAWPERLLSLTVPTGGGKTLASMAFALRRAALQPDRCQRIIVVIPFLSIIEQNARVYADALGPDAILEHHSGRTYDDDREAPADPLRLRQRLAVENWDAPIIVTTSVQFFDSLFSNRSSDLRKVHSIARSIVILDEVQMLPRNLLRATLSMMDGLRREWGTTFVLCTATQPAFEKSDGEAGGDVRWPRGTLREIIPDPQRLFGQLRRVTVAWPGQDGWPSSCSWEALAERMAAEPRVLCVVNTKRHAAELYAKLKAIDGVDAARLWHLSTRLCPRHRLDRLDAIRQALQGDGPCRVVSTQLVEAGVDLDFPVVFRAMGPLDAITQAAGRCDREGRLTAAAGRPGGRVVVFEPDVEPRGATPPGIYAEATVITREMLGGTGTLELDDLRHIRGYFQRLYGGADLDPNDVEALRRRLDFREVAQRFSLISDQTVSVLVPYNAKAVTLITRVTREGMSMGLRRQLQHYQVGLFASSEGHGGEFDRARHLGAIYEVLPGTDIWACQAQFYSKELGLTLEPEDPFVM